MINANKMQGRMHIHTFQLKWMQHYGSGHRLWKSTISPRRNKQDTIVVNLGAATVLYNRWKEWLSEHADPPPPQKKTHPFKLNLL